MARWRRRRSTPARRRHAAGRPGRGLGARRCAQRGVRRDVAAADRRSCRRGRRRRAPREPPGTGWPRRAWSSSSAPTRCSISSRRGRRRRALAGRTACRGAPGPAPAQALRAAGVPAARSSRRRATRRSSTPRALWQQLRDANVAGRSVLVVRGDGGRDWLAERLRDAGAQVDFVQRLPPRAPRLRRARSARCSTPRWPRRSDTSGCFSSSRGDRPPATRSRRGADWSRRAGRCATHPRIAAGARAARLRPVSHRAADARGRRRARRARCRAIRTRP